MTLNSASVKHLSLDGIQKAVDSLGNLVKSTLNTHTLALVIGKNGEATFTRCGWKILTEAGFSSPLAKIIVNGAKKYTNSSGDDCKYFIFILQEMVNHLCKKIQGSGEACMRIKYIHEISSLKRILPCIYNSIQSMSEIHVTNSNSYSFSKDLHSIVLPFMLSKFSENVSKHLSSLICDFILGSRCENSSLKVILEYVICRFDVFCSKVLATLPESRVVEGFVFCKQNIYSNVNLENSKFIIVWDVSMKYINEVSWEIHSEGFVNQLNHHGSYKKIFDYFKEASINLVLTPSVGDKEMKFFCEKNDIVLLDRLDKEEIEHILSCLHFDPLENLNEVIESKHIGNFKYLKSFSNNKLFFLNLVCSSSARLLNPLHIILSAPIDALWKEYYSECLNCLKMVQKWLSPNPYFCSYQLKETSCVPVGTLNKSVRTNSTDDAICNTCSQLKINSVNSFEIQKILYLNIKKTHQDVGIALPPGLWELLFKSSLERVCEDQSLPCRTVSQILHSTIVKCICEQLGVPIAAATNLESIYSAQFEKSKLSNVHFLESVVLKEIMICSVLDLVLQLLKIDGILCTK